MMQCDADDDLDRDEYEWFIREYLKLTHMTPPWKLSKPTRKFKVVSMEPERLSTQVPMPPPTRFARRRGRKKAEFGS